MIGQGSRSRRLAWATAWVVAYALSFQLILTTAVIASLPRDGSIVALCVNSAAGDPSSPGDPNLPVGVHCPACLARIDLAGVAPPVPAVVIVARVARPVAYVPLRPAPVRTAALRLPLQPRAPPARHA